MKPLSTEALRTYPTERLERLSEYLLIPHEALTSPVRQEELRARVESLLVERYEQGAAGPFPVSAEELSSLLQRLDTRCARWPHDPSHSMIRCGQCTGCHANRLAERLVERGPNQ